MTDMQELMRQADKTIDSMSGTNR